MRKSFIIWTHSRAHDWQHHHSFQPHLSNRGQDLKKFRPEWDLNPDFCNALPVEFTGQLGAEACSSKVPRTFRDRIVKFDGLEPWHCEDIKLKGIAVPKIHLIPKWRPINYSFVCMLISPLRLIFTTKFFCFLHMLTRWRGLINMQTKE